KSPSGSPTATYTGPALTLPEEPGWNYIEVAVHIDPSRPALMRTKVNQTTSSAVTAPYTLPGSAEYALGGLVTIENKYALSDLFVFRNQFREFITNNDQYDFTTRANVRSEEHTSELQSRENLV